MPSSKVSKAPVALAPALRKPQVAVLEVLVKAKQPMTRTEISEKSRVRPSSLSGYLGSYDKSRRDKDDAAHYPSLIGLGYVKVEEKKVDDKTIRLHSITPNGRKALERVLKS